MGQSRKLFRNVPTDTDSKRTGQAKTTGNVVVIIKLVIPKARWHGAGAQFARAYKTSPAIISTVHKQQNLKEADKFDRIVLTFHNEPLS